MCLVLWPDPPESSSKRRWVYSTSLSVAFVDVSFKCRLQGDGCPSAYLGGLCSPSPSLCSLYQCLLTWHLAPYCNWLYANSSRAHEIRARVSRPSFLCWWCNTSSTVKIGGSGHETNMCTAVAINTRISNEMDCAVMITYNDTYNKL